MTVIAFFSRVYPLAVWISVDDHIVVPCSTAILGSGIVIAGDGGHGQGNEEGIGGGSNHFGDLGFYQQIQTYGQIFS